MQTVTQDNFLKHDHTFGSPKQIRTIVFDYKKCFNGVFSYHGAQIPSFVLQTILAVQ